MKYEIIKPPQVLQEFVRYFSILDYYNNSETPNQIKVFTDRYPHLVFQHCNGDSAFSTNGHKLPTTFLSGIKITPYTCDIHYKHSAITVTFYPQAIKQLFGIDVHELNNELVDIREFSAGQLNDQLLHAKTNAQKIDILVDFLVRKTQHYKNETLFINSILHKVNSVKNEQSISSLLSTLASRKESWNGFLKTPLA